MSTSTTHLGRGVSQAPGADQAPGCVEGPAAALPRVDRLRAIQARQRHPPQPASDPGGRGSRCASSTWYLDDREVSVGDQMGEVEQFIKSWASAAERASQSEPAHARRGQAPRRTWAGPRRSRVRLPKREAQRAHRARNQRGGGGGRPAHLPTARRGARSLQDPPLSSKPLAPPLPEARRPGPKRRSSFAGTRSTGASSCGSHAGRQEEGRRLESTRRRTSSRPARPDPSARGRGDPRVASGCRIFARRRKLADNWPGPASLWAPQVETLIVAIDLFLAS